MKIERKNQIEAAVKKFISDFNLEKGFNIRKLVKNLGFDIAEGNYSDLSGALIIDEDKKLIVLNQTDSSERKRFTIGHEVGHLILHEDMNLSLRKNESIYFRSSNNPGLEKEYEANYFAACLLMNREWLFESLNDQISINEGTISKLAREYEVSEQAMAIRLSSLGFV